MPSTKRLLRTLPLNALTLLVVALLPSALLAQNASPGVPTLEPEASEPIAARLKSLNDQGQFEQAYRFGVENLPEKEGEPLFDFHFGLAALESGHHAEAMFCFERLVAFYPEQPRFRLEYARTLYLTGQMSAAETQFRQVLATRPPAPVRSNVERFLRAIEQKSEPPAGPWSGHVEFGGGFDSNINNATDERFVGLFELADSAREDASAFVLAETGLAYDRALNQKSSLGWELATGHKHNLESSNFNLDSGRVSLNWKHKAGNGEWQPALSYSHLLLDGGSYQRNTGLSVRWRQPWSKQFFTIAYGGLFKRDSFDNPLLDNLGTMLSLTGLIPANRMLHSVSLAAGTESPDSSEGQYLAKDFASLSYRLDTNLTPKSRAFGTVSGYVASYGADNPTFGKTREDSSLLANAGFSWRFNRQLSALAQISYTHSNSNIDLYDYSRWKSEVRARWQF